MAGVGVIPGVGVLWKDENPKPWSKLYEGE